MDPNAYPQFFLQPSDTWHRRYEALRAVFVEPQPLPEVAERFSLSHGTVRNWVSQFRAQAEHGQPPPFSNSLPAGVPPLARASPTPTSRPMSRMPENSPWKKDAGCARAWRACFCSCRCWRGYVSIGSSPKPTTPARKWCPPSVPS